jgi:monomeric isocitrate dehydrogenase
MAQKAEEYGSHDKTFEIPAKVSCRRSSVPDPVHF